MPDAVSPASAASHDHTSASRRSSLRLGRELRISAHRLPNPALTCGPHGSHRHSNTHIIAVYTALSIGNDRATRTSSHRNTGCAVHEKAVFTPFHPRLPSSPSSASRSTHKRAQIPVVWCGPRAPPTIPSPSAARPSCHDTGSTWTD